jgi:hypothetical protein
VANWPALAAGGTARTGKLGNTEAQAEAQHAAQERLL